MRKRIPILVFILVIGIVFVTKDYFLKTYLLYYVRKNLHIDSDIESFRLFPRGIIAEGVNAQGADFKFNLRKADFEFDFSRLPKVGISSLILENALLKISDTKAFSKRIQYVSDKNDNTAGRKESGQYRIMKLDLKDINIEAQQGGELALFFSFSFRGNIGKGRIERVENIEMPVAKIKYHGLNAVLNLKKERDFYVLAIPSLRIKDKEVKNISLVLEIDQDMLKFSRLNTDFFGPAASAEGVFDFKDYHNLCLKIDLINFSFSNTIDLLGKREDISLEGYFGGELTLYLDGGTLSNIKGNFSNTNGGIINIKKEAPLEFLQKHLDKYSYEALLNNFKNYNYDEGQIEITKETDLIKVLFDFRSDILGRRTIGINFHNN
jgi:hypothetical protein